MNSMNRVQTVTIKGQSFAALGNVALLDRPKTGLLCSRQCPADRILTAHAQFKGWSADPSATIVSGFHSPVEQECLRLLLQGRASIIHCPAREIATCRISKPWRTALDAGRMLMLSPFVEKRATLNTINRRNRLIAELSDSLIIPHASPGGRLENVKKEFAGAGLGES
jgi:predicted Rossmann fold nucleotide-binding protein DprA/Smf involved in DNA uptake